MNGKREKESRQDRQDRDHEEKCERHKEQIKALDDLTQAMDGIAWSIRLASVNIALAINPESDPKIK